MIYCTFWPWHMKKKSISYTWTARKNTLLLLPPWGTSWKTSGESKNSNVRIWKQKNQPRKWWPSIVPAEFLPLSLPFFSPGQFPTSDWWLHYAKIDWAAMGHLMFFEKGLVTRCVKDGGRDVIILLLVFVLLRTLFFFLLFVNFPNRIWDGHVTGNRESKGNNIEATTQHVYTYIDLASAIQIPSLPFLIFPSFPSLVSCRLRAKAHATLSCKRF